LDGLEVGLEVGFLLGAAGEDEQHAGGGQGGGRGALVEFGLGELGLDERGGVAAESDEGGFVDCVGDARRLGRILKSLWGRGDGDRCCEREKNCGRDKGTKSHGRGFHGAILKMAGSFSHWVPGSYKRSKSGVRKESSIRDFRLLWPPVGYVSACAARGGV
jgi:hypothetical protein